MSLLFARKCRLQLWLYYPFQILSHSHSKHFIFHEEENASTWHGKAADDFDSVIDRIIVSWVWCITYIFCALALTKYRRWIGKRECVYREKIPSLTSWVLLEIGALLILTPISFRLPNTYVLITQKELTRNWNVRNLSSTALEEWRVLSRLWLLTTHMPLEKWRRKKIGKQLSVLMNYYYFRCWFSDNFPLVIQNSPQKPIQQWSKLGKVKKSSH